MMFSIFLVACLFSVTDRLDASIELLQRTESSVVSADYSGLPLEEVLVDLSEDHDLQIAADFEALARLGIDQRDSITMSINGTLADVLDSIALSLGDEFERPVFEAYAGRIVLTTVQATASMRYTHVYDVRDLLGDDSMIQELRDTAPPFDVDEEDQSDGDVSDPIQLNTDGEAKTSDLHTADNSDPPHDETGESGESDETVDRQSADDTIEEEPKPEFRPLTPGEDLIYLITDHVDPDAWMNFGGNRAKISDRNGMVMITAPASTHRRMRQALQLLRSTNPSAVVLKACILDISSDVFEKITRRYPAQNAAFVTALRLEAEELLWETVAETAINATYEMKAVASEVSVGVKLIPHVNDQGVLSIEMEASTSEINDERHVSTTITFPTRARCGIIEIPEASPGSSDSSMRLLVMLLRRM